MVKFILISILIFFFIRLVAPWILRFLLKVFVKKQIKKHGFNMPNQCPFQHHHNQRQQHRHQQSTGKINIDYIPEDPNKKDFRGGEYVDYEEVK